MKAKVAFTAMVLAAGTLWPASSAANVAPSPSVEKRDIELNYFSFPREAHDKGMVDFCWSLGEAGTETAVRAAESCWRKIPGVKVKTEIHYYCWNGKEEVPCE